MAQITDDLGTPMPAGHPVRRVVSLVPSLTESIACSDAAAALVGATDWCTHPADLEVARVRGTKNPDLATVQGLRPDLVVANKEENRELDVRRLRAAGVRVWVTEIETLDSAFASLRRLFTVALAVAVPPWVDAAVRAWRPAPAGPPLRVAIPIWRDPWMVVGPRTFTGDLVGRAGLVNVFGSGIERYPHTTAHDIVAAAPDVVLLPDEPYAFTGDDGPEALPGPACVLVEGRALTWYGPSLAGARAYLDTAVRRTRTASTEAPVKRVTGAANQ